MINKLLKKILDRPVKDKYPEWLKSFTTKVINKDHVTQVIGEITEILLDEAPGHKVFFLINGVSYYACMDPKYNILVEKD